MSSTFKCSHCGRTTPCNPRLKKKQKYCSEKDCQRARMCNWKRRQYRKNNRYREKCLERQKIWRKNYPADQYQEEYRKTHPLYTEHNRKLQGDRNKKRQKEYATAVIKTKAIVLQPGENGTYLLSKVKKNMIVNRNALSLQPSIDGGYTLYKIKERKIVNRNALMAIRQ